MPRIGNTFDLTTHEGAADPHPGYRLESASILEADIADENITSRKLAPVLVEKSSTANTTINSGTDTDITGASISVTPAIACMAIVWATFDMYATTAGDIYAGRLKVDGVNQGAEVLYQTTGANHRHTLGQHWVFPLTAAAHTIKLQAARSAGSGSCLVYSAHTKLTLLLIGDANAVDDTSS